MENNREELLVGVQEHLGKDAGAYQAALLCASTLHLIADLGNTPLEVYLETLRDAFCHLEDQAGERHARSHWVALGLLTASLDPDPELLKQVVEDPEVTNGVKQVLMQLSATNLLAAGNYLGVAPLTLLEGIQ